MAEPQKSKSSKPFAEPLPSLVVAPTLKGNNKDLIEACEHIRTYALELLQDNKLGKKSLSLGDMKTILGLCRDGFEFQTVLQLDEEDPEGTFKRLKGK